VVNENSPRYLKSVTRFNNNIELKDKQRVPGPGAYDSYKVLQRDGRYSLSKYKDSGSNALKSTAARFFVDRANIPGPGQYNFPEPVNPEGRNFVSKFQSSFSRSFGSEKRALGKQKGSGRLISI